MLGGIRGLMEAMLYENRALHDRLRVLEEERANRPSTNSKMESVRDIPAAEGPLTTSPGTERMPESAESPSVVPVQAAVAQQMSGRIVESALEVAPVEVRTSPTQVFGILN